MAAPWESRRSISPPGASAASSTESGPGPAAPSRRFVSPPCATGVSVQVPSLRSEVPTRAARVLAAPSASGAAISRREMPVAPFGCSAAGPDGRREERGVRSSIRKGRTRPSWRIRATRHRISAAYYPPSRPASAIRQVFGHTLARIAAGRSTMALSSHSPQHRRKKPAPRGEHHIRPTVRWCTFRGTTSGRVCAATPKFALRSASGG
jgi:hypothetical protein